MERTSNGLKKKGGKKKDKKGNYWQSLEPKKKEKRNKFRNQEEKKEEIKGGNIGTQKEIKEIEDTFRKRRMDGAWNATRKKEK